MATGYDLLVLYNMMAELTLFARSSGRVIPWISEYPSA
jgi:hypothetical protein